MSIKRGFIRGLWGINDKSHHIKERKYRVDNNIGAIIKNNYNETFVCYTYGKDSHEYMIKCGFNSILIDNEPFKWDLIENQYRHKLEILRYAMEEDKYDEIVLLDWDCFPLKRLPSNFWEELGKKGVMQANLMKYRRPKCYWRESKEAHHYLPNAGFLYIRDKSIPAKIIQAWEWVKNNKQSAEPAMAKVMDDMTDGWKGLEHYQTNFEPEFCKLARKSPYPNSSKKDICFQHNAGGGS